jgi:hypothetical protein
MFGLHLGTVMLTQAFCRRLTIGFKTFARVSSAEPLSDSTACRSGSTLQCSFSPARRLQMPGILVIAIRGMLIYVFLHGTSVRRVLTHRTRDAAQPADAPAKRGRGREGDRQGGTEGWSPRWAMDGGDSGHPLSSGWRMAGPGPSTWACRRAVNRVTASGVT